MMFRCNIYNHPEFVYIYINNITRSIIELNTQTFNLQYPDGCSRAPERDSRDASLTRPMLTFSILSQSSEVIGREDNKNYNI